MSRDTKVTQYDMQMIKTITEVDGGVSGDSGITGGQQTPSGSLPHPRLRSVPYWTFPSPRSVPSTPYAARWSVTLRRVQAGSRAPLDHENRRQHIRLTLTTTGARSPPPSPYSHHPPPPSHHLPHHPPPHSHLPPPHRPDLPPLPPDSHALGSAIVYWPPGCLTL